MIEINASALVATCNALLGAEKTQILHDVYTLVDAAERRGFAAGIEHEAKEGVAVADVARLDADEAFLEGRLFGFDEGFSSGWEEGYDEGYEQARIDMGECPMIDQDFDGDAYADSNYAD